MKTLHSLALVLSAGLLVLVLLNPPHTTWQNIGSPMTYDLIDYGTWAGRALAVLVAGAVGLRLTRPKAGLQ